MKKSCKILLFIILIITTNNIFSQSFNEDSDVINYMEGKTFYNSDFEVSIEYGYFSIHNTYCIKVTSKFGVEVYVINVSITNYGSFADLYGMTLEGGNFGFRLYRGKLIVGRGDPEEQTYYLKNNGITENKVKKAPTAAEKAKAQADAKAKAQADAKAKAQADAKAKLQAKAEADRKAKLVNEFLKKWSKKNLNVSKFRNGDNIPEAKTNEEWNKAGENKQPAWCYYNNDSLNGAKYGKLYNWYAVNDSRGLAPLGWHIPSDVEWSIVQDWINESKDITAFPVLLGGNRGYGSDTRGGFSKDFRESAFWWSSNVEEGQPMYRIFYYIHGSKLPIMERPYGHMEYGMSVRCIKD